MLVAPQDALTEEEAEAQEAADCHQLAKERCVACNALPTPKQAGSIHNHQLSTCTPGASSKVVHRASWPED